MDRKKPLLFLLVLTGICLGQMPSNAAILARYAFTDSTGVSTDDDAVDATYVTTIFSAGPGLPQSSYPAVGNPTPSRAATPNDTLATEALAFANNDYFEFTVTAQPGYELDLTSLVLDYDASFNTVDRGYSIRSSLNGYADTAFDYVELADTGSVNTFLTQTYLLSDPLYQNITGAVTFRIYVYDAANNVNSTLRFDNVILNGTASLVPEPSRALLLFGGVAMLLMRRRRQVG